MLLLGADGTAVATVAGVVVTITATATMPTIAVSAAAAAAAAAAAVSIDEAKQSGALDEGGHDVGDAVRTEGLVRTRRR